MEYMIPQIKFSAQIVKKKPCKDDNTVYEYEEKLLAKYMKYIEKW